MCSDLHIQQSRQIIILDTTGELVQQHGAEHEVGRTGEGCAGGGGDSGDSPGEKGTHRSHASTRHSQCSPTSEHCNLYQNCFYHYKYDRPCHDTLFFAYCSVSILPFMQAGM